MSQRPAISIVAPVYNEEDNITPLYTRLTESLKRDFSSFDYQIILVDDGSTDQTVSRLEEICKNDQKLMVIKFSRNFGHHIAMSAGLDAADGDFVVVMDGDLQDQPEEIIKLYNKLNEGYDVVYGERQKKQFSPLKRLFSYLFTKFIKVMVNEKIVINTTIFRIMRRNVVQNIIKLREGNRYLVGIIGWVGFKHVAQPVAHGARKHGRTKYNFKRQLALAADAIFSFSDYPLRLIARVGVFLVFLSVALLLYSIFMKLIYKTSILGWASIMSTILALNGFQFVILGVMSQYLGRTYMQSKDRPLYVIERIINAPNK